MIQRSFRMLNQFAVEISTLPVDQCHSHLIGFLVVCNPFCRSRQNVPPSIWDTHGVSWNFFFLQIRLRLLQHLIRKSQIVGLSNVSQHTSPHVMSESQTPAQDQGCQSGPSASNSFIPCEGRLSKNYGADQQRLQISDLHLTSSLHQQPLLAGR